MKKIITMLFLGLLVFGKVFACTCIFDDIKELTCEDKYYICVHYFDDGSVDIKLCDKMKKKVAIYDEKQAKEAQHYQELVDIYNELRDEYDKECEKKQSIVDYQMLFLDKGEARYISILYRDVLPQINIISELDKKISQTYIELIDSEFFQQKLLEDLLGKSPYDVLSQEDIVKKVYERLK